MWTVCSVYVSPLWGADRILLLLSIRDFFGKISQLGGLRDDGLPYGLWRMLAIRVLLSPMHLDQLNHFIVDSYTIEAFVNVFPVPISFTTQYYSYLSQIPSYFRILSFLCPKIMSIIIYVNAIYILVYSLMMYILCVFFMVLLRGVSHHLWWAN